MTRWFDAWCVVPSPSIIASRKILIVSGRHDEATPALQQVLLDRAEDAGDAAGAAGESGEAVPEA